MPFYDNVKKVMADAKLITERFCNTNITFRALRKEYRISYSPLKRAILTQISRHEYKRICKKKMGMGGIKTRFYKGHKTWNRGMKGWCPPGTESTRFKPGHIRGNAARRYKPVGTITGRCDRLAKHYRNRKRKDGMPPWPRNQRRYIKIKDIGPSQDCWIPYARYLWVNQYSLVPAGHFIVHFDGDTMNDDLTNLRCVNRKGHLALERARGGKELLRKAALSRSKTCREKRVNRKLIKKHHRNFTVTWECTNCGAEYSLDSAPPRCIKCGSCSLVKALCNPRGLPGDIRGLVA